MMNEEEVLIIGDDDYQHTELSENEDYLIVQDPEQEDTDSWCLLFVKGDYKDCVVRFEDVAMNASTGELGYNYTILSAPEDEYNELEMTNYLSSALAQVISDMHQSGAQRYHDLRTGEEITEL